MALQANNIVRIPDADKTQATALAIEFWTSKGFTVHSNSYNCIVFRRNGYGSVGKLIGSLLVEELPFDQIPTELAVLCQVLPKEAKYDLSFKLGVGYCEKNPGDFSRRSLSWCDEFVDFCCQWMNNASS